jgi:flagellar M-ring protein FliF
MEALNPVLLPLRRVWSGLNRTQQIGLGAILVALVGVLVFVSTVGHGSDTAVAFSGLSNDEEAAIVAKLKDAKIPYTLKDGGTIVVPTAQVQDAKLVTAGMGLNGQPGSGSGFELFNQPAFGQTEFTQKVNYQRALETELERSINQMAAVDSSRVHLVIPEQTLFASQQQPTTASIMLKLKPGRHLDSAQARSISNLVAGSVQGLKPQNLTIVDVNGNTLTPDDSSSAGPSSGLTGKQLDTQRSYESTTERNLQAMLDNVLGAGKASVRVSAVMNWDQVEQTDETYTPNDPTQTPVLTNHSITENGAAGTALGGVPGAASNNGSVPTYQGSTGASGPTSRTDTETTYQLNKSTQKTVRAPGAVTRLSVSVMLDDDPNNPNTALQQSVQDAVNAAAGIDPTRGDVLTVTALPFNRQDFLTQQAAMNDATQKEQLMGYLHLAALALGPLVMLGLLFFIFKRGRKKQVVEVVDAAAASEPNPLNLPALVEAADPAAPVAPAAGGKAQRLGGVGQAIVEDPQKVYIRDQVQTLGKSNPATVAQLIQTWLDEDRRN